MGVKDVEANAEFYRTFGFKQLENSTNPVPWVLFTDGENQMLVHQNGNSYTGMTYFSPDAKERAEKLEEMGLNVSKTSIQLSDGTTTFQATIQSPDDYMVRLVEKQDVAVSEGTVKEAPIKGITKCGDFGEFSSYVADLDQALAFWEQLGFTHVQKYAEPYPWAIIQDGFITLGLHNTSEFAKMKRPAMTYFAKDQSAVVEFVKEQGFTIFTETGPNSIVVEGPDKQQLFLFQW